MSYTVKQLAKLSGVSVRTLHFYDEIGLLPPARVGANGYRYYEDEQLLLLQQILFFRELGLPLSDVQKVLASPTFDKVAALRSHRSALATNVARTRQLIATIDKTIAKLEGGGVMRDEEMYQGFDPAKQAAYERELVERYGPEARQHVEASKERTKAWRKADWDAVQAEGGAILQALVAQLEGGAVAADPAVQALIARHYQWVCHFWTPNPEAYAGLGQLYVEHPDFRAFYAPFHPQLAEFLAEGMRAYAAQSIKPSF